MMCAVMCTGYCYDSVKVKLFHNVNNVISWFEANNMKVNPNKCQHIVFGKYDYVGNVLSETM